MARTPQFLKPSSLTNQAAMQREQQRRDDALEASSRVEAMRGSAAGVGGDPAGSAAAAVADHEAASNPHSQYATDDDLTAYAASVSSAFAANSTSDRDRANHSGSQLAATISDFALTVLSTVLTGLGAGTNSAISAGQTLLAALADLQAQIAARVPTIRTISTTAPLTGGGNLSANRALAISAATTSAAGSMSAADKLKLDGIADSAWTAPTLLNGWSNYGGTFAPAGHRLTWKRVYLRGSIAGGATAVGTSIFNLPAGSRPSHDRVFSCVQYTGAAESMFRLVVKTDGSVLISGVTTSFQLSIDGVVFHID